MWLPDASWLPWSLVAAIVAATPLVWMHRNRRFDTDSDEQLIELPQPVIQLQRALTRHPELAAPSDEEGQTGAVPVSAPDLPPPGGVGLVGDGAHAAARAALITALAAGGPTEPDACGEVVIDASTLATLIGADAVTLGPWPRLHICDDLDHALSVIDERLLHRSRLLDEHALTDLDILRTQAPDEEALPPVLLLCEPPPPGARMRARTSFSLGTGLKVSALLLGEWDHGATIEVDHDGHTQLVSGTPTDTLPERMAVIDTDTAVQVLLTLREAHTGTPHPAAITTTPQPTPAPLHAHHGGDQHNPDHSVGPDPADGQSEPATQRPAGDTEPRAKARLRVLGPPGIDDITEPGRPLRAKALELAVYLACHPEGVATRDIGEYLEPDARVGPSDQRVHTNASNLRHVLARAAGKRKDAYVIKTNGRYRLDPASVEVDLWQLQDLMRAVRVATGTRRRDMLRTACELVAPLAQGQHYEWVELHRQRARRWGTEAHLLLADDILADDPQAASDLLDKAIALDRECEALYQRAMRARHALHDGDGIRILLRALAKASDVEPSEDTIALANTLRTSLDQ